VAGAPQDGSGADGLDSTLLPADLNQTSRQEVHRMLRGAGVPFIDSDSIAVVCSKLAAATWAAEQLRKLQYSTATHAGPGDRGGMDSDITTRSGPRLDPLRLSRVPLDARSGIDALHCLGPSLGHLPSGGGGHGPCWRVGAMHASQHLSGRGRL
jgi:hypothetical protein